MYDLITERFFRAPGFRTKHFERFYLSFKTIYYAKVFILSLKLKPVKKDNISKTKTVLKKIINKTKTAYKCDKKLKQNITISFDYISCRAFWL